MAESLVHDPAPPPPPGALRSETRSDAGAPAARAGRSSRRFATIPLAVLVASMVVAICAFVLTSSVVRDQERRLLSERADEVEALLANSYGSLESSLRVLGGVGSKPEPAAARLFTQGAAPLITRGVLGVGVATERDGAFVVATAVGDTPAAGLPLDATRAALARRAVAEQRMVSEIRAERRRKRLLLALPVASGRAVAYQESVLDPSPTPSTPESPFRGLRVVLYASERPDLSQLVVTTETEVPLRGRVEEVPFKVGAETWLLAVAPRGPLVGALTEKVPWVLLGGGVAMGLLATAVAQTLARRRTFALDLVEKRTAELKTALGELADTRAFLDRMLTSGPVLVLRAHLDADRVTYASPNIERLYGLSPAEARAAGFLRDRVHPDDLPAFDAALARAADGSSDGTLEYRFRSGDGSHRWTSGVFVADVQDDGNGGDGLGAVGDGRSGSAVLLYVLDVNDRRQADHARREAQEAAETANRAKSQFLSRMSHELRTPLNAVLGFGQLLELQPLTAEQQEFVGYIVKGGRHLLDLINEVLDISRVEAGELSLSPEAVLASGLVQETVDLIRPLADQRGIRIVVDRSGSCDCYVFADSQRAKQILLNLLSNAVKYNRPRGTIEVSCQQSSDTRMAIRVTDTGHGIPAERLGQLFTPFDRLGAENTEVEGTGIGLALSQRLAEVMGGTLAATSTLGQGSTFFVELPLVEGPVERYERLGRPEAPEPPTRPDGGGRSVLHIEDNLANLDLMERVLAQRSDIRVIAAMQGSLGLELAREHQPVLILLDLHLPDMSGEHVLQRLREDPLTASIPVVIVSADATTGQAQRLLAGGATAYITKPIDVPHLLGVLDEALSRT